MRLRREYKFELQFIFYFLQIWDNIGSHVYVFPPKQDPSCISRTRNIIWVPCTSSTRSGYARWWREWSPWRRSILTSHHKESWPPKTRWSCSHAMSTQIIFWTDTLGECQIMEEKHLFFAMAISHLRFFNCARSYQETPVEDQETPVKELSRNPCEGSRNPCEGAIKKPLWRNLKSSEAKLRQFSLLFLFLGF